MPRVAKKTTEKLRKKAIRRKSLRQKKRTMKKKNNARRTRRICARGINGVGRRR